MIKDLYGDPEHQEYFTHHRVLARLINKYQEAIIEECKYCDIYNYDPYAHKAAKEKREKIEKQMEWCTEAIDHGFYGD